MNSQAPRLSAGDLDAVFLPARGMLCASFRHRGAEMLRRVEHLDIAAARGSTAGIPFLHPWANRLAKLRYSAAGRRVELDRSSSLLHFDDHGLPIHGVPWSRLPWQVTEKAQHSLTARLEWARDDLLALFPFRHRVELTATLHPDGLTLATELEADAGDPVPVSFGFHPYFGLPGVPRAEWLLKLPPMRKLMLDQYGIPTGEDQGFEGFESRLRDGGIDDGFALLDDRALFSVAGAGRQISVELLTGYRYAQIFAPKGEDCIALEPMTAPTSALTNGRGLRLVPPGGKFRAVFRVGIGPDSSI